MSESIKRVNLRMITKSLAAATVVQLLPANPLREYLMLQVTNTNPASFSSDDMGGGISLDGASAAGGQGGAMIWDGFDGSVPIGPVYAVSAAGTTVVAVEG